MVAIVVEFVVDGCVVYTNVVGAGVTVDVVATVVGGGLVALGIGGMKMPEHVKQSRFESLVIL